MSAILFHFKRALFAVFFTLSKRLGSTEANERTVQEPARRLSLSYYVDIWE